MTGGSAAPLSPSGWENAAARLIRLHDPGDHAVAWFAPDLGGNCVGYAVRRGEEWTPVLHAPSPEALAERRTRYGCPVLFPFPAYVRGALYNWRGVSRALPANAPPAAAPRGMEGEPLHVHGFAHSHAWRVTDVQPACMSALFSTKEMLDPPEREAYPFDVELQITLRLESGALVVEVEATNEGRASAPVGIGLHPYIRAGLFGDDRARVTAHLPGRTEYAHGALPTGKKMPSGPPELSAAPSGESFLVQRTDFGDDPPLANLHGPAGTPTLRLALAGRFTHLALFVPAQEDSISFEPTTCALSAASRNEGDPDGPVPLDPGEQLRASMVVSVA